MRTPAARSLDTSSRLRGSSSQLRADSARTGPISFVDCSASSEAASSASIDPNARGKHLRPALADVAIPERVDHTPEVVVLAPRDLFDDLRRVLLTEPPLDRLPRARMCSSASPVLQGEVIEVRVVTNETGSRSAAPRVTRRGLRCSSRHAMQSARGRAAAWPGTRRSRIATRPPLLRDGSGCHIPSTSWASPMAPNPRDASQARDRRRGITSPAFSTMTQSRSRMSLRAMSSALWRVAIDTVVPPTKIGRAPRMASRRRCARRSPRSV